MDYALLSYWNLTYGGKVKIKLLGLPLQLHSYSIQSGSNKAINNGERDNKKYISFDQVKRLKEYKKLKKQELNIEIFRFNFLFCKFSSVILRQKTQLCSFLKIPSQRTQHKSFMNFFAIQ